MPGRDQTGPTGEGQMTGRGLGPCGGGRRMGRLGTFGLGRRGGRGGRKSGYGRFFQMEVKSTEFDHDQTQKELETEIQNVQSQLNELNQRLALLRSKKD